MDPAARIRIADPSPPYCAACYQAKPAETHVDFGAATDGPMLAALDGAVGVVGHSVDDVVICKTCIGLAARLVGLEDAEALRRALDEANARNDALHDQLTGTRQSVTSALDLVKRAAHGDTPAVPNGNLPVGAGKQRRPRGR